MRSPCLREFIEECPHGCCWRSPLFNSPEPLNNKEAESRKSSADCRRDFVATTSSSIFRNTHFTNHESLPSLQQSFSEFSKAYPQFAETFQIDQIRAKEYYHLSLSNHICLDYIGVGLFSYYQLQNQESCKYQNDSSSSCSSDIPFFSVSYKMGSLKTQLRHGGAESGVESAMKKKIMSFLNISENDYSMVFTANRTSAFKLLAESYPFQSSRKLLTVYDYESEAVEAMINTSEKKGAKVMSAEFSWPRLRIHSEKLKKMLVSKKKKKKKRGLFVFPLHSRVTGARYRYLWMRIAQENQWHILIDACALGPKDMDSFGLSLIRPDFLICSFYKIFGENPSGFGCLFVKKSTISILDGEASTGMVSLLPAKQLNLMEEPSAPSSFSGPITLGIIKLKPEEIEKVQKSEIMAIPKGIEASETKGDKQIELECRGLDQVDSLGLTTISKRSRCLINWLVNAMLKLQHPNTDGVSLVKIYGPKIKFDRGPALAFNVFDWKGEKVEPVLVQKLADRRNISLSYGALHHIWFSEKYQREKEKVVDKMGTAETKKKDKKDPRITVVTASLGFLANFEDAYRLWAFVAEFLDADFVEKARWRYTALNQKTVEV
ncbi:molybdenum cofactor sulfurase-like [Mangifera indica]|uniref:molybdenum cofactor sulfurase-like n=1 Tax=Mangifera indica TaxID=29780 RepID=UPI001CFB359E|nr:molybdenum cofactor sulfurase-like [Mangifera indica]